jgi:hypothetical protein
MGFASQRDFYGYVGINDWCFGIRQAPCMHAYSVYVDAFYRLDLCAVVKCFVDCVLMKR